MESNYRRLIAMFIVMLAVFGVVSATAAAASSPSWYVRKASEKKGEGVFLKAGESRETTLTGGAISVNLDYISGLELEVKCAKSSGIGSVIGGEPGKAKVTLSFSECEGSPSTCEKSSLLKLENIEGELAILKNGETVVEKLKIPSSKEAQFLKIEDPHHRCFVPAGTYWMLGNLPGLVNLGEALEFPSTPAEGFSLEWEKFRVLSFTDKISQKLVNGETLFAYPY